MATKAKRRAPDEVTKQRQEIRRKKIMRIAKHLQSGAAMEAGDLVYAGLWLERMAERGLPGFLGSTDPRPRHTAARNKRIAQEHAAAQKAASPERLEKQIKGAVGDQFNRSTETVRRAIRMTHKK